MVRAILEWTMPIGGRLWAGKRFSLIEGSQQAGRTWGIGWLEQGVHLVLWSAGLQNSSLTSDPYSLGASVEKKRIATFEEENIREKFRWVGILKTEWWGTSLP